MTMVSFKQRGKGKETILRQINARNPDQVLHPHWENWGKRVGIKKSYPSNSAQTQTILHMWSRYSSPTAVAWFDPFSIPPVLNVVLFGQEDFFTHCSFEFIVWPANWRQTSPTHRIIHFFLSISGDRRNRDHTCTHICAIISTFRQALL